MSMNLQDQIAAQEQWAREEVASEWSLFQIDKRDGYLMAVKAAESSRLTAMMLMRAEAMAQGQAKVVTLLRIIAALLVVITCLLGVAVAG